MPASVLIIDAEEEFAQQLAAALDDEGIPSVVTQDGKAGLDLAKANVPSAIVLCVELPRMSGYSICAKLKKDPILKDVPLVITSVDATPETFEHHKRLKTRAEEYLKKPFPPSELISVLSVLMPFRAAELVSEVHQEEVAAEAIEAVEDAPPQVLDDNEVFSAEEASSMVPIPAAALKAAVDLSRPVALAEVTPAEEVEDGDGDENEQLTSVGLLPSERDGGGAGHVAGLLRQISDLTDELEAARVARDRAEKLATAAQAAAPSQPPTTSQVPSGGGRDVVTLKKELNQKEREIVELQERVTAKDRELLSRRDRETELEGQIVQLEEEREAALSAQSTAEAATGRANTAKSAADQRAIEAEQQAKDASEARQQAEQKSQQADQRATQAEQKAKDADRKAMIAEGRSSQAEQRAKDAESRAQAAQTRADEADANADEVEGRLRELEVNSKRETEELQARLGEAAAREAELDQALAAVQQESSRAKEELAISNDEVERLTKLKAEGDAERTRLSNELSAATAESESLRAQLAMMTDRAMELEGELTLAKSELATLRSTATELEQERDVADGRASVAYQRIRDDEKVKGKAKKAIEIALALLQEAGFPVDGPGIVVTGVSSGAEGSDGTGSMPEVPADSVEEIRS